MIIADRSRRCPSLLKFVLKLKSYETEISLRNSRNLCLFTFLHSRSNELFLPSGVNFQVSTDMGRHRGGGSEVRTKDAQDK